MNFKTAKTKLNASALRDQEIDSTGQHQIQTQGPPLATLKELNGPELRKASKEMEFSCVDKGLTSETPWLHFPSRSKFRKNDPR